MAYGPQNLGFGYTLPTGGLGLASPQSDYDAIYNNPLYNGTGIANYGIQMPPPPLPGSGDDYDAVYNNPAQNNDQIFNYGAMLQGSPQVAGMAQPPKQAATTATDPWGALATLFQQNPTAVLNLAAGLMAGPTLGQGLARGIGSIPQSMRMDLENADMAKERARQTQSKQRLAEYYKKLALGPDAMGVLESMPLAQQEAFALSKIVPNTKDYLKVSLGEGFGEALYNPNNNDWILPPGGEELWERIDSPLKDGRVWLRNRRTGDMKTPGPSGDSITIDQRGQDAFDTRRGNNAADLLDRTITAGGKGAETVGKYQNIEALFSRLNFKTGPAAEYAASFGALLEQANIDPKLFGISKGDVDTLNALNGMTNSLINGLIGTGPDALIPANTFSEKDREIVLSTVPRIGDTPDAFKMKLAIGKRAAELAVEKSRRLDRHLQEAQAKNGKVTANDVYAFERMWQLEDHGIGQIIQSSFPQLKPNPDGTFTVPEGFTIGPRR